MPERYYKRRLTRAFADTIGPLGWNRQTLWIAAQATVVFLLVYWAISGKEAVKAELEIVLATVAAFVIVFVGNFVWNYFATPARMQAEADREIETLRSKINNRDEKQKHIDRLSDFLDAGISNIWAVIVTNDEELKPVAEYWEKWQKDVDTYLEEHFTHSNYIHFHRLGVVPRTLPEHVYATHDQDIRHWKILREYAEKETRLRDIIRDNRPQILIT